jgi:two-component sensor histidine kinase
MIPESGRRLIDAVLRYGAAVLLALCAQLARLPLGSPTSIPFITYVPFILMSAALGGFGPGLLATGLCSLGALYFAVEPIGSLTADRPEQWLGLGTLALTGVVSSALFDRLLRARREAVAGADAKAQLAQEVETRQSMLESMIQNSPAAMALLGGPDFTFEVLNPAYQALAPGELMAGRTVAEVWPEAAHLVMPLLHVVRDAETAYHATGYALPLHRGPGLAAETRYFDFSYVPLRGLGAPGEVTVLAVAIEVTKHKEAEEALRTAYSELAAIHANAPVVMLVVDDQLRVEKVNDLATRFSGRERSEILGCHTADAIGCLNALADPRGCGHGPTCSQCPVRHAVLDTLRSGSGHNSVEGWLPLSIDGRQQQRCLLVSTAAMQFDRASKVLVCAQDITELKLAQIALRRREEDLQETVRQLEPALAEKTVLLQEVHHRVKNNLAVISSLLGMKADAAGSSEARMALEESRQRVHSIALIHEHLYGNDHLDRINFSDYARHLVEGLYSQSAAEPGRIAIKMDLDPIELDIERAVPCALILNELLSNAFKYAFPDGRNGKILVRFCEREPGSLELVVEDNGIGLPAGRLAARNTESLGLRIVGILTRQLDGSLEQEDCPGARIVLRFPVGPSGADPLVRAQRAPRPPGRPSHARPTLPGSGPPTPASWAAPAAPFPTSARRNGRSDPPANPDPPGLQCSPPSVVLAPPR